ncbi:MAG: hypothetical protein QM530_04870 [Phycisphaerales bacterium]|nr:hypothetical protein [Phycisphaerales bacterium]
MNDEIQLLFENYKSIIHLSKKTIVQYDIDPRIREATNYLYDYSLNYITQNFKKSVIKQFQKKQADEWYNWITIWAEKFWFEIEKKALFLKEKMQ